MLDWYERYYAAIRTSRANARFCELVYGRDLGQHGFMDEAQREKLLAALQLRDGELAVDLGCGDGRIAEAVSDDTGARVLGVDNSANAVRSAAIRTSPKRDRLAFVQMEIDGLALIGGSCDAVIAVDTLYFTPLQQTIDGIARIARPGCRLACYYSRALPNDGTDGPESLRAGGTPLAEALRRAGFWFEAIELTAADYAHTQLRKAVLPVLAAEFAAEGNQFIYDNRLGEAEGISRAIEAGAYSRHLYVAHLGS